MTVTGTIRFEDLGEPVQRLLKSLKGGYSEEDMALLQYVSVKDMAKIYGELSSDYHADKIWAELCAALRVRREKAQQRELELLRRQQELAMELEAAEREQDGQEALVEPDREPLKEQHEQGNAEAAGGAVEEEAARRAEKERRRAEKKRLREEARRRELQEEQEALKIEQAKQKAAHSILQKKAWEEYVANNPLDFPENGGQYIKQERVDHGMKAPPQVSKDVLNRTYTPKCPNCGLKFMKPPNEWDCPVCLRRLRQHIKVWQPDESSSECVICHGQILRFFRHHCRSCGRLVCASCSLYKAVIPALGFDKPQKVCNDCACQKY